MPRTLRETFENENNGTDALERTEKEKTNAEIVISPDEMLPLDVEPENVPISELKGKYWPLSNYAESPKSSYGKEEETKPYPIYYKDRAYRCAESAYQAALCINDEDKDRIVNLSGKEAREYVKALSDERKIKVNAEQASVILKEILKNKFYINPENNKPSSYARILDNTKNRAFATKSTLMNRLFEEIRAENAEKIKEFDRLHNLAEKDEIIVAVAGSYKIEPKYTYLTPIYEKLSKNGGNAECLDEEKNITLTTTDAKGEYIKKTYSERDLYNISTRIEGIDKIMHDNFAYEYIKKTCQSLNEINKNKKVTLRTCGKSFVDNTFEKLFEGDKETYLAWNDSKNSHANVVFVDTEKEKEALEFIQEVEGEYIFNKKTPGQIKADIRDTVLITGLAPKKKENRKSADMLITIKQFDKKYDNYISTKAARELGISVFELTNKEQRKQLVMEFSKLWSHEKENKVEKELENRDEPVKEKAQAPKKKEVSLER